MKNVEFNLTLGYSVTGEDYSTIEEVRKNSKPRPNFDRLEKVEAVLPLYNYEPDKEEVTPDGEFINKQSQDNLFRFSGLRVSYKDNVLNYFKKDNGIDFNNIPKEERYVILSLSTSEYDHGVEYYEDNDDSYFVGQEAKVKFKTYDEYTAFITSPEILVRFYVGKFDKDSEEKMKYSDGTVRLYLNENNKLYVNFYYRDENGDCHYYNIPQIHRNKFIEVEFIG